MKRRKLAVIGLLVGLLGIAWAVAQEEKEAPTETPEFRPTESIRADQGVAFPVDI